MQSHKHKCTNVLSLSCATQLYTSLCAADVPCPPGDNREMQHQEMLLKPMCLKKCGPSTAVQHAPWQLMQRTGTWPTGSNLRISKGHKYFTHYLNIPTTVLVL